MKKILKYILFFIFLFIFIFSGYKLFTFYQEDYKNEQLNQAIVNDFVQENIEFVEDKIEKETVPISVDFEDLKKQNKDIVGWIYQPNTKINYPIVQGVDNNQYLRRTIYGKYSIAGSIFLDYRNDAKFEDFYSVLYGHHIKNNSMFGSLVHYKTQAYYNDNPIMYLLTPDKNYKIDIFMGFVQSANEDSIVYNTEITEENLEDILTLYKKSTFKSNILPGKGDKIICLSTCSYEYNNARYVVFGVLKGI